MTHRPRVYAPCEEGGVSPLWSEWLLANGTGGYAMGTAAGVPTRRYHGLLIGANRPPVDRVVGLTAVVDRLTLAPGTPRARTFTLTPLHFRGAAERPITPEVPCRFEKSAGVCRWTFRVGEGEVEKTLLLADGQPRVSLDYRLRGVSDAWQLDLRPLVALRDFHGLSRAEHDALRNAVREVPGGVEAAGPEGRITLRSGAARAAIVREVWRDVEYFWEARRGMDCVEHLLCPAVFTASGRGEGEVTLEAAMGEPDAEPIVATHARRMARLEGLTAAATSGVPVAAGEDRAALSALADAADDFVVGRGSGTERFSTVIAGYPWFSDWGRDTMIALPGLMLLTGRHAEAFGALRVFARHRQRGLIPNRFDDYAGAAHYNTVDASLWFLHAAAEYRRLSGDDAGYRRDLAPACEEIIEAYAAGTDHGIAMDPEDGLVTAGAADTQLTWMDAQRDGVTFTPRHGKAVEINALWGHGLLVTAEAAGPAGSAFARRCREIAARVRASFNALFPDPATGGLFDRLEPRDEGGRRAWHPVGEVRPNQVFAASLSHSPLDPDRRKGVVAVVRGRLLTPRGLRTLAPGTAGYVGRLGGSMFERDAAYHNGTAWPWLIGHYAEAALRAGDAPAAVRAEIAPMLRALASPHPGTIAEIYDAEGGPAAPQRPDGCVAQAWSVAELLRAVRLVATGVDA